MESINGLVYCKPGLSQAQREAKEKSEAIRREAENAASTLQPEQPHGLTAAQKVLLAEQLTPAERRIITEYAPQLAAPPRTKYARQRRYHDKRMRTVSTKLGVNEAERFRDLCERYGVTRHIALAAYIDQCVLHGDLLTQPRRAIGTW